MDMKLEYLAGGLNLTFEKASDVGNNLMLSLTVQRGSFFANPHFGSRLHQLQKEKNVPSTWALIPEYVREATQWMIDLGKITRIETVVEQAPLDIHRLMVRVSAFAPDGGQTDFETFVTVG